uniref:Alpha 1,4-glycosyltransferase domain-containing protein n=2 Tax=Latimeria chalumnae TaxID=7897 RepID=H3A0X3_LATCH
TSTPNVVTEGKPKLPTSTPTRKGKVLFVETTDRLDPSPLAACAIESAARTYLDREVHFYMKGIKEETLEEQIRQHKTLQLLSQLKNVQIQPLDFVSLFEGTPLLAWYKERQPEREQYAIHILADACRLVLVWKYGGTYLDTDIISLQPAPMEDFVAKQDANTINNAAISFHAHHPFLQDALADFVQNYNGGIWGHQGPGLLTRVMSRWCAFRHSSVVEEKCQGINIYNTSRFYPIPYTNWRRYFATWTPDVNFSNSFGAHLWNFMNKEGKKIVSGKYSVAEELFKKHCLST